MPAEGIEFLGRFHGSGFRRPRYLLRRRDGQVAQLPWLLYRTAWHIDGHRPLAELARRLRADPPPDDTDEPGQTEGAAPAGSARAITAQQVGYLIEDRLRPAGLAGPRPAHADAADRPSPGAGSGQAAGPAKGDHLLMLRLRTALVPAATVWRIAGPLRPLFRTPVVLLALAAFVAVDAAVVAVHGMDAVLRAGTALTTDPTLTLAVLAVIAAAGAFHECGHVTACRYGGATPGSMGVGVYLVWPAFYSTVTDAYRLSRTGRLRTDLGGLYFNTILLTGLGAAYLATGQAWLLATMVVWHAETAWQLLPSLRLDGYYVLADLVGVPDLFNRIRPVLRDLLRRELPRRLPGGRRHRHRAGDDRADPLVAELHPWARRVVTAWVVLVVPFLAYWVILFAVLAPQLAPSAWNSLTTLAGRAAGAALAGRPAAAVLAAVSIVLLVLPWVAGTYLVGTLLRRPARGIRSAVYRRDPGAGAHARTGRRRPPPRGARPGLLAGFLIVLGAGLACALGGL